MIFGRAISLLEANYQSLREAEGGDEVDESNRR